MIVLDENYVNEHLDTGDCIALMEKTLKQEEEGGCVQYMRTAINMPNHNILGLMPAYFEEGYFGAKILSVYLSNHSTGYPSHQGQILLFEKEYGQVIACVDAMSVTKIRTGAVSAAVIWPSWAAAFRENPIWRPSPAYSRWSRYRCGISTLTPPAGSPTAARQPMDCLSPLMRTQHWQ